MGSDLSDAFSFGVQMTPGNRAADACYINIKTVDENLRRQPGMAAEHVNLRCNFRWRKV